MLSTLDAGSPVREGLSELDTAVLTALRRIIRAADLDARQIARRTGLTTSQLLVLRLLADQGELTIGGIAGRVGLTQGTVTTMIDRLHRQGVVTRRRSDSDRRQVKVSLTTAGAALLEDAPTALQTRFLLRFAALEKWEKHQILASLIRLADLMDAAGLDASPVLDVGSINAPPD